MNISKSAIYVGNCNANQYKAVLKKLEESSPKLRWQFSKGSPSEIAMAADLVKWLYIDENFVLSWSDSEIDGHDRYMPYSATIVEAIELTPDIPLTISRYGRIYKLTK